MIVIFFFIFFFEIFTSFATFLREHKNAFGLTKLYNEIVSQYFPPKRQIVCDAISAVCIIPGYIQEMLFMGDA